MGAPNILACLFPKTETLPHPISGRVITWEHVARLPTIG
jgi:hypothetical protein